MNKRQSNIFFTNLFTRFSIIGGVDEAGRGPLAGPVVAGSVIVKNKDLPFLNMLGLDDSKKISQKKREFFYQEITQNFLWSVGIVSNQVIDKINIFQATFYAMRKAFFVLKEKPSCLIVDGKFTIPKLKIAQYAIPKADALFPVVSAASIIAKVTRDRIMEKLDKEYPNYHFKKHKGYGTKDHLQCLKQFGPSPIHRFSFNPTKNTFNKSK